MISFVRSLLRWTRSANNRTVVGRPVAVDIREATYIQDSKNRLNALFHLYNKFRGTPHEQKFKSVYEKTKNIHAYLEARKKVHELELFHIQHTEHFINTFTVILDAHQRQQDIPFAATTTQPTTGGGASTGRRPGVAPNPPQPVNQMNGGEPFLPPEATRTQIPRLTTPEIRINVSARIRYYVKEGSPEGLLAREIGLNSSAAETKAFLADVTARFGIGPVAYLGNALVHIPDNSGAPPTGMVPVIRWQGTAYALHLSQNRLFPVAVYAESR
jgi:hypothetical protein